MQTFAMIARGAQASNTPMASKSTARVAPTQAVTATSRRTKAKRDTSAVSKEMNQEEGEEEDTQEVGEEENQEEVEEEEKEVEDTGRCPTKNMSPSQSMGSMMNNVHLCIT